MNFAGLLPWQPAHAKALLASLTRYNSCLDASDTGTGKTYVALFLCRELGVIPLVVGPRNSRATWEKAARVIGVDIEFINYEKVRGRRALRGGVEVDCIRLSENRGALFDTPVTLAAFRNGKCVLSKRCDSSTATDLLNEALFANKQPCAFIAEYGEYKIDPPAVIGQEKVAESEWILEKKYGSGSYVTWKNRYCVVIFDEVHRCGGSTSLNSKLLIAARRQAKYILAISATAADSPQQMKALGFSLGLHQLNGKFGFRPWLYRHGCAPDDLTGRLELTRDRAKQEEVFEKLHKEIFPLHGSRMRKSEIPEFPRTKLDVKLLTTENVLAKKLSDEVHALYTQYDKLARETSMWVTKMQALEALMIPDILEMVEDLKDEARVAIFVSYTDTRLALTKALQDKFGKDAIGFVDGTQVGPKGEEQRNKFVNDFQANKLVAIVCNSNAGGESISLHDPTGKVERISIITPQDSGKRLKQILGRVDRAHGANSVQYLLYFAGTEQEKTAERVQNRLANIDLLNDSDLMI